MCFEVGTKAPTSLILSLLDASCELKWGLSSSKTGVGGSLFASSSAWWLSRTGILPDLLPPTTGILLSPDDFTCGGLLSLEDSWRLVRDSLCSSSVLDSTVGAPLGTCGLSS